MKKNSRQKADTNGEYDVVEPDASNMVEALRDIGYSLESAVADIIDNSISAHAKRIDLRFGWSEDRQPWIAIVDDGCGMSDEELVEAMRPGGRDPLGKRPADDLGRFGLGLKTASFSQCRKLTVLSRKDNVLSARQWDLDLVRDRNKWMLRRPDEHEISRLPAEACRLTKHGTIVLWQQLDRLDLGISAEQYQRVMNERMMTIHDHIALVFHRFISPEPGKKKVVLTINRAPVEAFDPFGEEHPATMHLGDEELEIEGKKVMLRPYILPHHSRVSPAQYEKLGGREGYLRGQGFYIYRNRRLIIHGTWFRMARQDQITRLARVQVDIPNTLDHLWTIDVRKSRAQPPEAVRKRLRGIVDRIRENAKRPYTHRGTAAVQPGGDPVWLRKHLNNRIAYTPNPGHMLMSEFRTDLPAAMRNRFDALLSVIGASLPFASLFSDMASNPKETDTAHEPAEQLEKLAGLLFGDNPDAGDIASVMRTTEPFASAPRFTADYISRMTKKGS